MAGDRFLEIDGEIRYLCYSILENLTDVIPDFLLYKIPD